MVEHWAVCIQFTLLSWCGRGCGCPCDLIVTSKQVRRSPLAQIDHTICLCITGNNYRADYMSLQAMHACLLRARLSLCKQPGMHSAIPESPVKGGAKECLQAGA